MSAGQIKGEKLIKDTRPASNSNTSEILIFEENCRIPAQLVLVHTQSEYIYLGPGYRVKYNAGETNRHLFRRGII